MLQWYWEVGRELARGGELPPAFYLSQYSLFLLVIKFLFLRVDLLWFGFCLPFLC